MGAAPCPSAEVMRVAAYKLALRDSDWRFVADLSFLRGVPASPTVFAKLERRLAGLRATIGELAETRLVLRPRLFLRRQNGMLATIETAPASSTTVDGSGTA